MCLSGFADVPREDGGGAMAGLAAEKCGMAIILHRLRECSIHVYTYREGRPWTTPLYVWRFPGPLILALGRCEHGGL